MKNRAEGANVPGYVAAYIVKRLVWGVFLLLAIIAVTYVVFFVIPTDRSRYVTRNELSASDIRSAIGVHGSVFHEYGQYVWNLAHGSLGHSFRGRVEVSSVLLTAAPVTASLVLGGAITWLLIAFPVGVLSAVRSRSIFDRLAMILVLAGISVHPVWLGLILSYVFGYKLNIFPLGGYCNAINPPPGAECGGPVQWVYHLILPWLTFATLYGALYVRMVRATIVETLNEDYVRTARAKGASEWRVLRSHVLSNALLPIVTMTGMDIGVALGGTIFVEDVFGLNGLGRTMTRAVQTYDLPIVLGVLLFMTLAIVVFNIIVDITYALIDPRVRAARAVDGEERVKAQPQAAKRAFAEGTAG
ncbi:MAG TPA: ABC transporter permease [Gaiellaceae bacterium]|nr:ABC transporter permease [Gaiellaceae bacterium]